MKQHGCHNRAPFVAKVVLREAKGGEPEISYPNRAAMDCRYSRSELGEKDAGCVGCKWRITEAGDDYCI